MTNYLKHTIFVILIAAAALVAGVYLGETAGLYLFSTPSASTTCPVVTNGVTCPACPTATKTTAKGSDECRDKLIEIGFMPETVTSLSSAIVKSVSGDSIIVEVNASAMDILQTGMLTKTVKVPGDVKIEERVAKSQDDITKESSEFQTKAEALRKRSEKGEDISDEIAKLTPPAMYTVEYITVSDINAGDYISVTTDSDIRESDSFDATAVVLLSRAANETTTSATEATSSDTTDTSAPASTYTAE